MISKFLWYCVVDQSLPFYCLGAGRHYSSSNLAMFSTLIEAPCMMSVQYTRGVQYTGRCSVHRGVIMSTVGGYHEYTGGCSVHWGLTMMSVGDIMSTPGDVQYTGGLP